MAATTQIGVRPATALPNRGRAAVVGRAVLAGTMIVILAMVFRLPYGPYATLDAVTLSRENPQATIKAATTVVAAFAVCLLYILAAAVFFLLDPELRLFWTIATLLLMFFAQRVVNNFSAAVDGKIAWQEADSQKSFEELKSTVRTLHLEGLQETFEPQLRTFLELSNRLKELGTGLSGKI